MSNFKHFPKTLAFIAFFLSSGYANAGGYSVLVDTISIKSGRIFKPAELISVSFNVRDYEYGANRFKSFFVAITPANENLNRVTKARIAQWRLFSAPMKDAKVNNDSFHSTMGDSSSTGLTQIQMDFQAPAVPGAYKLVYNRLAVFSDQRLVRNGTIGQVAELNASERSLAEPAILPFAVYFEHIVTFIVAKEAPGVEDTLTVYLRANDQQPAFADIRGGINKKPLEFSWWIGPEFKLDKKKLLFRYKIFPVDTDWSAWTTETSVKYHFLPRGTLNFRVEARYNDDKKSFTSESAKFNFVLSEHLVAEATAATLFKGPIEKQYESGGKIVQTNIAFDTVYAASRALVIGVHKFDDKFSFREFPSDKIQKDVDSLETALAKNNFQVTKLFKDRVTRDEIVSAIELFVEGSKENDRLFIYFSTHGFADKNSSSEGYIATSDCELNKPTIRCLRLADIEHQAKRALEGKKVRQVLIAVDSCFSGLGVISKAAGVPNFSKLAVAPGAYMLTAGMADQLAQIDPNLKMSTFTHYLARGLEGEANIFDKNGIISLTELFLYVQYNVAKQTDSRQIPMLGRLRGDGEMLFRPTYAKK